MAWLDEYALQTKKRVKPDAGFGQSFIGPPETTRLPESDAAAMSTFLTQPPPSFIFPPGGLGGGGGSGGSVTTPVTTPPVTTPTGSSTANSAWTNYLSLVGAGATGNPEAERDWAAQQSGKYYRRKARGFDLYGLVPQDTYWENLAGSGLTYEDVWGNTPQFDPSRPQTTIRPDQWWIDQTQGSTVMPGWMQSDFADLERAWPSMSAADQQLFLDRMLYGTGLPTYLQDFQRTRPQFITDYITKTFVPQGA